MTSLDGLGLRYPGASFSSGHLDVSDTQSPLTDAYAQFDNFVYISSLRRNLYVCPARYSEVRKVVFWVVFNNSRTTTAATEPIRLRVASMSSQAASRNIETVTMAPGFLGIENGVGANVWTNLTISDESVLWDWPGSGTAVVQTDFGNGSYRTNAGDQLVYVTYDRFLAGSADFFNDWDTVAGDGDDVYLSIRPILEAVGAGSVTAAEMPGIISFGMTIVQAPTQANNTCTVFPATLGQYNPGAISGASTEEATSNVPFYFDADDWDGIDSITLVCKQVQDNTSTLDGKFRVEVNAYDPNQGDLDPGTLIYAEDFDTAGTYADIEETLARTEDFKSQMIAASGSRVMVRFVSIDASSNDLPYAFWEITQTDFNRKVCVHAPGAGNQFLEQPNTPTISGAADADYFGKDAGLFDPSWYDNFPDELILFRRMWGAISVVAGSGADASQRLVINGNLTATMVNSGLNVQVSPELSTTPNATVGYKFRNGAIESNDPIDLAGLRKMKIRYSSGFGIGGPPVYTTDQAGAGMMMLAYALNVPNREFLDLGPLFSLDAFNPEGCAATAAGGGDPGVLVITNGSTIPQKFNPVENTVEDAGIPTPFCDEVPSTQVNDAAASPEGGLSLGTYIYRYTFRNCCTGKESDPNPDDIEVDTSGANPAASVTLSFSGVRIPGDEQICEICIYRTLVGGDFPILAKVGCFDVNTASSFVDTVADSQLDFVADGLSLLNGPMPCVPVVVEYRNRVFGFGDIPELSPLGTVSAVNGSDIITGDGDVVWTRCLEGKYIQLEGDCRFYEIDKVLPPVAGTSPAIGRLKLVEEYEGDDNSDSSYVICGRPNRLYGSEPVEPECWPAANFLDIEPGDGDRLIGGASNFDSLVICKRRKTYVLRFRENPFTEVIVPTRISSDIGAIGPRTFAQVASGTVWLSDRGIAIYDGRSVQHLPESDRMNDLFTDPSNPRYVRRDSNGRVIEAVGVFYPKKEQYLLLLPTVQTDRGCNLMVVWDSSLGNITIYEFCQEFLSMVVAKDSNGDQRVYLGDTNGFVWIFDVGDTDGVGFPNATGTVRGTITSAGVDDVGASFLDDSTASFLVGGLPGLAGLSGVAGLTPSFDGDDLGLAGACIAIRPPGAALDDPWDIRTVYAATSTRVYVTPPWGGDVPVEGSEYMIGAIDFTAEFKPTNFGTDDFQKRDWKQVLTFEPETKATSLRVELKPDLSSIDDEELTVVNADGETGDGRTFDLSTQTGRFQRPVGRRIYSFEQVVFRNFAPDEPVRILNHTLRTTPRASK